MNRNAVLSAVCVALVFSLSVAVFGQDRGLQVVARDVVGSSSFQIGKQYAVIIGIDRYHQWPALRNAVSDAKEIRRVLSDRYYIDEFFELYDQDATAANIRRLFSATLPQTIGLNDSLLIFYSGHGYLDSSKTGFWIAADGVSDINDQKGWIPNAQIRNYITQFKAQRVLLISDSCFSGDFLDVTRGSLPSTDSAYYRRALQRTARQVLTSGASEAVPDSSEFARQLLSLLERNGDFILDPYAMYDRIRLGVTRTSPLFGTLPGNEQGSCFALFLRNPSSMPTAAEQPSKPPVQSASPAPIPAAAQRASPDASGQGGRALAVDADYMERIRFMLYKKEYLDKDKREELRSFASMLSESERRQLYDKNDYGGSSFLYGLANSFYGLGSWLQGDFWGGVIISGAMFSGLILSASESETDTGIGTSLLVGGMMGGWVRPFFFKSGRNAKLREALRYY